MAFFNPCKINSRVGSRSCNRCLNMQIPWQPAPFLVSVETKKSFTCQEGEVCRTGDGEVRRCDVYGFDSVSGHVVQVWRVHVAVVIPAEPIEGDQQHLLPGLADRCAQSERGQEEAETRGRQHGENRPLAEISTDFIFQLQASVLREEPHLPQANSCRAKFHQLILSGAQ